MLYLIAVFKNRTESLTFLNLLHSYSPYGNIISTPKELQMPCGISVSFPLSIEKYAIQILKRRSFSSFVGIYKIQKTNNSIRILPNNF